MTSVAFDVSFINDTILEGNESFILAVSLPNRFYCDYPCMATVTIVDTSGESLIMPCMHQVYVTEYSTTLTHSCKIYCHFLSVSTVRFNQSRYSVNESDGKVNIILYHSNPSSIDIKLKIYSKDVSAHGKC